MAFDDNTDLILMTLIQSLCLYNKIIKLPCHTQAIIFHSIIVNTAYAPDTRYLTRPI